MRKFTGIALGILTSIGGFLEAGSVGTALEAGAAFRYELIWALVLGVVCVAFLVEMSGRLAAVSGHTLVDAMRARLGFPLQVWPFTAQVLLDLLTLASEIGGAAVALHLATGAPTAIWAIPVALLVWLVLWKGKFGQIEHSMSMLGLVTLAFVVAAIVLRPDWHAVAAGLAPSIPTVSRAHYGYLAVSIIGASASPYLITFYSSGAVEEKWNTASLGPNRVVAGLGMGFGAVIACGALATAAIVLAPRGVRVESFDQVAGVMTPAFGRAGFWLFCASLFVGCLGASLELSLDLGYTAAQTFGWDWSENRKAWTEGRFALVMTGGLAVALLPSLLGVNPFRLTMFSMAITGLALPLVTAPLLIVMNDPKYLKRHTNGAIANAAVIAIVALAFVLAIVSLPLEMIGS